MSVNIEKTRRSRATPEQKRRTKMYRKFTGALSILSGLCAAAWMFLDVPYKLFEALNLLFPVAAFLLYCILYGATLAIKKEVRERAAIFGWMFSGIALYLRFLVDFNFDAPEQFILPVAHLTLAALALFFAINARGKLEARRVLSMLASVLLFSVPAVGHCNYLLDDGSRVTERAAVVTDKAIQRGGKSPTEYLLHLSSEGETLTLETGREIYVSLAPGDAVRVATSVGFFGIAYSEALPVVRNVFPARPSKYVKGWARGSLERGADMKINFLTSAFDGGFPEEFARELRRYLAPGGRFAFVASDFAGYEKTRRYAGIIVSHFAERGFTFSDVAIVDGLMTRQEAYRAVRAADAVWLSGGPTLRQIADIRRCGLIPPLRAREGVTIGMSAGAINMARRVVLAKDESDGIPELSVYEGIGLTDLNIEPHLNDASEGHLAEIAEAARVAPIVGLPDGSFIVERGGEHVIFGPHTVFK